MTTADKSHDTHPTMVDSVRSHPSQRRRSSAPTHTHEALVASTSHLQPDSHRDSNAAWALDKCVFPSRTITWVRTQRMSRKHGHFVPYLARHPASVLDSETGRSDFHFSLLEDSEAPPRGEFVAVRNLPVPRRGEHVARPAVSRNPSQRNLVASPTTTASHGRKSHSDHSPTSSSHNLVRKGPSEAGFGTFLTQLYGKDPYNKRVAEWKADEFQPPAQYPTRSMRTVLLISAIIPYILVCSSKMEQGRRKTESLPLTFYPHPPGVNRPYSRW